MKKITLTLFSLLIAVLVIAQSPDAFKYQTIVRDASGNAMATTNVDFRISILETSATGSSVYVETFSTTTNQFGLVNIEIGNGTVVSGDITGVDWANNLHFVKIEIDIFDGNGFQEMGTSQLLSVPYALNAKTAENTFSGNYNDLTNTPTNLSDFTNNTGFITDADDADADPTNELQVINISNDTLYLENGGQVFLGSYGNLWQQNDTNIYYNNGWVGVGTDSPTGMMVVQGDEGVDPDSALFEVKNKNGQTIFAVYDGGVRIYVDDTGIKASTDKGGFAVAGYRIDKAVSNEYLRVTPDSLRMYFDNETTSGGGHAGGFAIQSFDGLTKSGNTGIMYLQSDNYFIGENSGVNLDTGMYNSTFGYRAGSELTNGYRNVFVGYLAGDKNTQGSDNVFIGNEAGTSNTGGINNIAIGSYAGSSLDTMPANNVMIGKESGKMLTNGFANIFIGSNSGESTTDGIGNIFIGDAAGLSNDVGMNNLFMGSGSGFNNTNGQNNIFLGVNSGGGNTTGVQNIFIGKNSGENSTTANYNTFLGFQAGFNNQGDGNVFLGEEAGFGNYGGEFNICIGKFSGHDSLSGSRNVFIGYHAGNGYNVNNTLVINSSEIDNTPLIYGNFSTRKVVIDGSNTNNLNNRTFFVKGDAGGWEAWWNDSDKKLKKEINTIDNALDKVMALRGVTYFWKDTKQRSSSEQIGFIAQEAQKVIPQVVQVNDNHYAMQYAPITAILVEAVKEQQAIINNQKTEIELLRTEMENIKKILGVKTTKINNQIK